MASGGKFLTGLLSFIFGFLFGIIAIIGSVAGVALYALTANFEDLFEIAGIENRDENGDYVYVNTGVEGISNALDLIKKLQSFADDPMNRTLGEIDYYLPVTESIVEEIANTFADHGVIVDVEGLKNTKFNDLSRWFIDTIYSVEISTVIQKHQELEDLTHTNVAVADQILELIIYGRKIQFVENGSQRYEVYTDTYTLVEDGYVREADGAKVGLDKAFWMQNERVQTDGTFYDVKYYNANGTWYVTDKNLSYTAEITRSTQASNWVYTAYSSAAQGSSGDYYVDANGKIKVVNPINVGTLVSAGYLTGLLNEIYITDFVSSMGNEIINELLGGISLGAILDKKVDFDHVINSANLSVLLGDVKATDALLPYVLYGITNVTESDGGYVGTYYPIDENGYVIAGEPAVKVNIAVDGSDYIQSITTEDGKEITGTTVGQINGIISGVMDVLAISDLLDISDSSIMAYIGYGISGMQEIEGKSYQYTAKISDDDPDNEDVTVYVTAKNGYITGVYYNEDLTQAVSGTKIGDISGIVDGIMEDLKVKDIINIDPENALMVKIGEYTISNIGDAIDEITLPDVMDIKVDNSIMAYMGYGIKGVEENAGADYTHTATYIHIDEEGVKQEYDCFINADADGVIIEAWYDLDGERQEISGTIVNSVGDRIDGVTEDLLVKDIIDIDPEDKLMSKLGEYSINNIGDAIDDILITDVMDIEAESAIMAYMGYGIKGVESVDEGASVGYTHTAIYIYVDEAENKEEIPCYINTDANGTITKVWYDGADGEQEVEGTPVNDMGDRIDGVTEDLLVKDIIEIDPDDKLMSKLGEYSINNMGDAIDDILITDVMDIEAESAIMAYMGFGITEITMVDQFNYTASYVHVDEYAVKTYIPCNVVVDENGVITKVWYDDGTGEQIVEGTPVNDMGDRIDGITEDLKIKDVIEIDPEDKFMSKLGEYKLNEMGSAVDELELGDFMDVEIKESGNILAYVAYGLTNINAVSGEEYQYTATIDGADAYVTVDAGNKITGVYQDEALQIPFIGTKVNNVGARVDGIMEDLTLGDIITISPDNTMLYALRNTTVNGISDRIATLSIQELYSDSIYEDGVLDVVTASNFNSNYIYYIYEDGELVCVNNEDAENRGKLTAFDTLNTYYTYGEAVGVWKFMVYENGSEKLYTVNDMGDLMTNTTNNIGSANLYDLAEAGIIDGSLLYYEDGVTPKIITVPIPGVTPIEMGTLTIEGLIEVIGMFG
ncbi:MAG: hypothetical protein E7370_00245 [Clostridiales bacterium]|nr:hypothetical protein [Clostridiales bacterium]